MTEQRKLQPADETIPEPLSPELALVDPVLANLAGSRWRHPRGARGEPRILRGHARPVMQMPSAFEANGLRWSAQVLGRQTIAQAR